MSEILKYYEDYYKKGGEYSMETHGGTSRVLTLCDWIKEYVPAKGAILDIGCGDMTLSTTLPEYSWRGIDINIDKAKGEALKHNIEQVPYPLGQESFDAIVCSEVLEHVWDMRVIHKEAHRLLKPGGVYIVSTPNFDWIDNKLEGYGRIVFNPEMPWTLEHIRQYKPETHEKFLNEAGFKIQDITGADAQFSPFMQRARGVLKLVLAHQNKLALYEDDRRLDQVLGRMFPFHNHTICFVSKKESK